MVNSENFHIDKIVLLSVRVFVLPFINNVIVRGHCARPEFPQWRRRRAVAPTTYGATIWTNGGGGTVLRGDELDLDGRRREAMSTFWATAKRQAHSATVRFFYRKTVQSAHECRKPFAARSEKQETCAPSALLTSRWICDLPDICGIRRSARRLGGVCNFKNLWKLDLGFEISNPSGV